VILIAHRLSTVRECNRLFKLKNGRITARGSYRQVVGEKAMADG
jgi:ABC-type multidrug transport system fused ATPase/permease subunit